MNLLNFRSLIAVVATVLFFPVGAQDLRGAWKLITTGENPFPNECIKIYSDAYFMFAEHTIDGAFIKAGGGHYMATGQNYTETPDFHSSDSLKVRQPVTYSLSLKKDELTISVKGQLAETWKKVDEGRADLSGAWSFGARVDEEGNAGERRPNDSPRQTMKILSGKYFQWAAFNYETKEFSGTGGGTYVLRDSRYTETIRFFSRDNSRAGMSLTFECRLDGKDWYHKGKGTTGNPVSEVWEKTK